MSKKPVSSAGPAPSSAPPAPPTVPRTTPRASSSAPPSNPPQPTSTGHTAKSKKKTADATPPDPNALLDTVKHRIAALEEDARQGKEDETRAADEARENIKGIADSVVQTKYIELFQEMRRIERDFSKEKQKLVKEKDASKLQLNKITTAKTKLEGLARELQKDNKKLRDDLKRMTSTVLEAQDQMIALKDQVEKRRNDAKQREEKRKATPEIKIKVVCKYRAEFYFKVDRTAKLSELFEAWTSRLEDDKPTNKTEGKGKKPPREQQVPGPNGVHIDDMREPSNRFIFCHLGRPIEPEHTPNDLDMEAGDVILAVEFMDLTVPATDEYVKQPQRERIKKHWTSNPDDAKVAIDEIFNLVVQERLKHVLRQYELRERHYNTILRSKELEVLVARARAEEGKQIAEEGTKQLRRQLEAVLENQSGLMEKLITLCKEVKYDPFVSTHALIREIKPPGESTEKLFNFLSAELERRGSALMPDSVLDDIPTITAGG